MTTASKSKTALDWRRVDIGTVVSGPLGEIGHFWGVHRETGNVMVFLGNIEMVEDWGPAPGIRPILQTEDSILHDPAAPSSVFQSEHGADRESEEP